MAVELDAVRAFGDAHGQQVVAAGIKAGRHVKLAWDEGAYRGPHRSSVNPAIQTERGAVEAEKGVPVVPRFGGRNVARYKPMLALGAP